MNKMFIKMQKSIILLLFHFSLCKGVVQVLKTQSFGSMIDFKILFYIYTSLYIAIYLIIFDRLTSTILKKNISIFAFSSLNEFCWFGNGFISLLVKKKTWFRIYFESIFMQKLIVFSISNYKEWIFF